METMSGKLGFAGAYNRQRTLNPIQTNQENHSATLEKLNKDAKVLKENNKKLRSELEETRLVLKQVLSESSHEKFDERRINLIKFQIIQLEKQIAMMNEALGFRTEAILKTENSLAWLADKFRSFIAIESKGPTVSISRSDLMVLLETSESARIKLFKAVEKCSKDEVGKDLFLLNPFLDRRKHSSKPISTLDVSLHRFEFLNLQHVSQLESKLSTLYKELVGVHEMLQIAADGRLCQGHFSSAEHARLDSKLLKSCVQIKDAADDLLALSLLCPSAPWPVLKRPVTKEVPLERVVSALPPLPHSKRLEVMHVLTSSVATCNHRYHLLEKEKAALREELIFHRSVYEFQNQYTKDLFNAVRNSYAEFEDSIRTVVCEPLKSLLDIFSKLKKSASEKTLRDFLIRLKEDEKQLSTIVDLFDRDGNHNRLNGSEMFASLEVDFITKLDLLVQECQRERNIILTDKKKLKEEQEKRDLELQHLIEELEAKYEKQWIPSKSDLTRITEETSLLSHRSVQSARALHSPDSERVNKSHEKSDVLDSSLYSGRRGPSDFLVFVSRKESKDDKSESHSGNENSFVLRNYLDEESDWVSSFDVTRDCEKAPRTEHQSENCDMKVDCSKLKKEKSKREMLKWKPDQEWVNDFCTGTDHETDSKCYSSNDIQRKNKLDPLHLCENNAALNTDGNSYGHKSNSNKVLTYKPNLTVAQKSLILKKKRRILTGPRSDEDTLATDMFS